MLDRETGKPTGEVPIDSPAGLCALDDYTLLAVSGTEVVKVDVGRVAIQRDAERGTYSIEAAVPFKELSIDPNQTDALHGDVGVIDADESGRNRAMRLYYYNKHTEMIADLPTESTLQPSEWGVIEFQPGR